MGGCRPAAAREVTTAATPSRQNAACSRWEAPRMRATPLQSQRGKRDYVTASLALFSGGRPARTTGIPVQARHASHTKSRKCIVLTRTSLHDPKRYREFGANCQSAGPVAADPRVGGAPNRPPPPNARHHSRGRMPRNAAGNPLECARRRVHRAGYPVTGGRTSSLCG